jgi:hypothetical protein
LEANKAFGDEAFAPLADGVAVAVEFGGDVLVGRGLRPGGEQDDAATKDERLRGRTGADEVFEVGTHFSGQHDHRAKGTWHGNPPGEQDEVISRRIILATDPSPGQTTGGELVKWSSSTLSIEYRHVGENSLDTNPSAVWVYTTAVHDLLNG